jgi:allantoinase
MNRVVVRGRRVWVDGAARPAALVLEDGRVAAVAGVDEAIGEVAEWIEAGERLVTPGLVDSHVHVNEPGRADWEGFATATAAAAAGGITTLVDMPLNAIPATTTRAAAEAKRLALEAAGPRVDVALWGGVVSADPGELEALAAFGVAGFKCFLSPSGVAEFPHVGRLALDAVLPVTRALGLPLLAHAESPPVLERAAARVAESGADPRAHATWLASRPPEAEDAAIAMLIDRCRAHRAPIHVVHVASASALPLLAAARAEGLPFGAEACLHHLTFAAEQVPDGATHFKCAPPLRERAIREALWTGLAAGTLTMVTSDHSPCPPELRALEAGDFLAAWGGIAGLQFGLSGLWTEASARGHGLAAVVRWAAEEPARLAGLARRKGRLAPGFDADLVVWDDDATWVVEPGTVRHRHPLTPYAGRELRGVVHQTWVRGRRVYDREQGLAPVPSGAFVPAHR